MDYQHLRKLSYMTLIIFDEMNSSHSGYKENEEYIYSPLVLIANENVLNINSGFNVSDSEKDIFYRKVEKNLFSILEAIEQGKTWQDIGVNAECLEGPVILGVPDIYSYYRKQVKDLFMLNLTAEDINEQNYEELEQRENYHPVNVMKDMKVSEEEV